MQEAKNTRVNLCAQVHDEFFLRIYGVGAERREREEHRGMACAAHIYVYVCTCVRARAYVCTCVCVCSPSVCRETAGESRERERRFSILFDEREREGTVRQF